MNSEINSEQFFEQDVPDPIDFWSKKQRELVTATVDYNLGTLFSLINDQQIDLSPRYQRRNRWGAEKQSMLIESFLMNVPVPPIFLNEDDIGNYSVIDGKQRLQTLYDFFSNHLRLEKLNVFNDINGHKFLEVPKQLQTILRTRPTIRAIIILKQSDPDIKHEVFQRLNTGGATLNAQEIRNNAYSGPLNDLIMQLATDKEFHSILRIKNKDKSAIYREMRDAELVLRFFTFRDQWETFPGGVRRHLDAFMDVNRRLPNSTLRELQEQFRSTLAKVKAVFGDACFQRWQPEKGVWRNQPIASLFDAQMFAFQYFPFHEIDTHKELIYDEFQKLFDEPEFRRSVDSATNTPTYFRYRINRTKKLLEHILGYAP